MKKIITQSLLILLCFLIGSRTEAQDLDQIIQKHIDAHGGSEAWSKIENLKITGKLTAFSVEKDYLAYKTSKGEFFSEHELGQYHVIEAFNGNEGWTLDPWQEILFPRTLSKAEINTFLQKADFFTPFLNYKEKGYKLTYEGKQDIDGEKVHVIIVDRNTGRTEKWYLNARTYLEYKCESFWVDFLYPTPCESYFEDFQEINGVKIPFYIERTFGQRNRIWIIENVEVNTEIDSESFDRPRSNEMKKLEFMSGEWDVKCFMKTRMGSWHNNDKFASKAEFEETNLLTTKVNYDMYITYDQYLMFNYNSEIEKYQLSVFDNFSSQMRLLEGELTDTSIVFNDLTARLKEGTPNSQMIIYDISDNEFKVIKQISVDKGESWVDREKFEYVKKK